MTTKHVRRAWLVAMIGALLTSACASVPTVPGGPLQPAGTVQLSDAHVVDMVVDGTTTSTFREDSFHLDVGSSLLLPARLGTRVSLADWLDVEADGGWSGVGVELRAGAPEGAALPFAVSVGGRSGAFRAGTGPVEGSPLIAQQRELRARFELYPVLSRTPDPNHRRVHGVLAAGLSQGLHYHWLSVPYGGGDAPGLPNHEDLLRSELRIEGAAGVELRSRMLVVSLIAMPYAVARADPARLAPCGVSTCDPMRVEAALALRQNYGVSLTLSLSLALNRPETK